MNLHEAGTNIELYRELRTDCTNCSGLCCTALFFSKMDGFPENKSAGKPCVNLQRDFRCKIHNELNRKKMKGCMGYDCFGAGQKVTKKLYGGSTWLSEPQKSKEIFDVFLKVFHLHQMLWFLMESRTLLPAKALWSGIDELIEKNQEICSGSPEAVMDFELEGYKEQVNGILKEVGALVKKNFQNKRESKPVECMGKNFSGKNFDGSDFSMTLLIAADFSGCSFSGANFLGTDMRDVNFKNADLREAVFLTQAQINSARGNANTLLPLYLTRPETWI